jgi:hypothetical protein
MISSRLICSGLCVLATLLQSSAWAGQASKPRIVPAAPVAALLDMEVGASAGVDAVGFRAADAMQAQDRQAVHDAWPVLSQKSAILGFDLNLGQWNYRQIVCPIFSRHIALLFSSNSQNGRSMFSAVIPESDKENVRILPVLRRGYAPFQSAAMSSSTIAAFNAIRASASGHADWRAASLCYAALAGAPIQDPAAQGNSAIIGSAPPTLELLQKGTAIARFVQAGPEHELLQWQLLFDRSGQLVKVTVSPADSFKIRSIPAR